MTIPIGYAFDVLAVDVDGRKWTPQKDDIVSFLWHHPLLVLCANRVHETHGRPGAIRFIRGQDDGDRLVLWNAGAHRGELVDPGRMSRFVYSQVVAFAQLFGATTGHTLTLDEKSEDDGRWIFRVT